MKFKFEGHEPGNPARMSGMLGKICEIRSLIAATGVVAFALGVGITVPLLGAVPLEGTVPLVGIVSLPPPLGIGG